MLVIGTSSQPHRPRLGNGAHRLDRLFVGFMVVTNTQLDRPRHSVMWFRMIFCRFLNNKTNFYFRYRTFGDTTVFNAVRSAVSQKTRHYTPVRNIAKC